jgi:hypothetical protein
MRVCITVLALALGVLLLHVERGLAQEGQEFAPKNGMFTLKLPAGEKKTEKTKILAINKHKVPIESTAAVKDGTTFSGGSIGIPAVVMREIPADTRFDILKDAFVKGMKGKVDETKDVKTDGVPGKEYLIAVPKGVVRMQLYTVAGWVIFSTVQGTKEQVASKEADAFFASLKMTDKAQKVFAEVKR